MVNISENGKDLEEMNKYVGVLVSEITREKWKKFANENNLSTTSNLVRKAVNSYIDLHEKLRYIEDFSKISHELKRPLTSIKGFAQLLIDNHKQELSWEALLKVKEIIDNSKLLEKKIVNILDSTPINKDRYEILIVDDDESTVNLLLNYFQKRGYRCHETFLGNEVFDFLDKYTPKLILLDILLPDRSGYEICTTLKFDEKYKKFKDIPIYYVTAVPEFEVAKKLKETGAKGYFLKPFDFQEFDILFKYLGIKKNNS